MIYYFITSAQEMLQGLLPPLLISGFGNYSNLSRKQSGNIWSSCL